ncbi:Threonine ammonia-lyase [Bertholletia excelsa]
MEAICFGTSHSSLLRPKFSNAIRAPSNDAFKGHNSAKIKPLTRATLSKTVAFVSPQPAVDSCEKPSAPAPLLVRGSSGSLQCPAGFLGAVPDQAVCGGVGSLNSMQYLMNILPSNVYDVATESLLQFAPKLSDRLGMNMWLKREDLQCVFSFKLLGAYNMMAKLPKEQLERGVICSSAGNHAQGVYCILYLYIINMQWKSVKRLGATVVLVGDSYDEAQAYAKKLGEEDGRTFIPPFDHPDVIMGQGTVAMEIVRQMQDPLHAIFVPVGGGGGGLTAGIAAYVKRVSPEVQIIGVEPMDANAMPLSLHHGQRIMLDQVGGFADGVAVKVVGEETFRICRELIDDVVLVSRNAICASIKDMFGEKRSILEPAGALGLAGAEEYCKYYGLKDENLVAITSGANLNFDRLRLVTELVDVGRQREAVLATFLPGDLGSFKRFCELVGPMNITEFKYRYNSDKVRETLVLYSVGFHTVSEPRAMIDCLESSQLRTVNLTNYNLVKDHLRHLMGGRSNVQNELLCRFEFPERPDALMKSSDALSPRWSTSYRAANPESRYVAPAPLFFLSFCCFACIACKGSLSLCLCLSLSF